MTSQKNNITAGIWKYANNLLTNFTEVYNYTFIKEEAEINEDIKKFYTMKNDIIKLSINNLNNIATVDLISFMYRYLEEMGLDDITININNENLTKYLNILDIDYEIKNMDDLFNVLIEDYEFAKCTSDKEISLEFNLNDILKFLKDKNTALEKDNIVEVFILKESEEEELKGIELLQNLRLSGIKTEIDINGLNKEEQLNLNDCVNARFLVNLNNEDLQKGLITIKDNILNEEFKIDEFEIMDYLLSNL